MYKLTRFDRHGIKPFLTLPLAVFLAPIVCVNYYRREKGLSPDEFYWADELMCRLGWCVTGFWSNK